MKRFALTILCGLFIFGCGPKRIPGLSIEVPDTPEHRAILKVLDSYRDAFQAKDADALQALASPRFFEDSGSAGNEDDYNYEAIRTHFGEHFKKIKQAVLDVQLKSLTVNGDTATVDYRFVTRYLMDLPAGERWQVTDDVNRMQFVRENNEWKILSGM
jgi:hypothetical protein